MRGLFKKSLLFVSLGLGLWILPVRNSYGLVYVGASIPISFQYTATQSNEESAFKIKSSTGLGLSVTLPLGLMLRYDSFDQTYKEHSGSNHIKLFSIGYRFDFSKVHAAGAFGLGTDEYKSGDKSYSANPPMQLYGQVGYSFVPFFDAYLGLHMITGQKIKDHPSKLESKLSAQVISLGFNFGF